MSNNGTWDESKHPRDEEGKFTYKNGGSDGVIRGGVEETVEADPRDISNADNTSDNNNEQTKEILLDLLKTVLEEVKSYSDSNNNNIGINNLLKTTDSIYSDNKTENIKPLSHNINSSNNKNNKTSEKYNTNSIDKISNPNKLKLGFGILQPKKQRNIEDILYPTMEDTKNLDDRYKINDNYNLEGGIEERCTPKTVKKRIEDILYPTMQDFNPRKKTQPVG